MTDLYCEILGKSKLQEIAKKDKIKYEHLVYCTVHKRYYYPHGQREWVRRHVGGVCCSNVETTGCNFIYRFRQEDLQDIYEKHGKTLSDEEDVSTSQDFNSFAEDILSSSHLDKLSFSETNTILWCLFIHKELWNRIYDFDKKKWVVSNGT